MSVIKQVWIAFRFLHINLTVMIHARNQNNYFISSSFTIEPTYSQVTHHLFDEKGYVTFQPEMEFNETAKFTMILKGIDLDKFDMNNADFIIFDKYKGIERIDYKVRRLLLIISFPTTVFRRF